MGALADRWAAAMGGSIAQQKYKDKINAVTNSPMAAAADAVDSGLFLQRVQAAVASGKMSKKLRAANFTNWKSITSTVGASNMVSGAQKGKPKMAAAEAQIQQAGAAGKAAAHAAGPDPAARMIANMNAIKHAWGYT